MTQTSSLNPQKTLKQSKKIQILVPPDGGWGWMIVLGTAISNIFNQSMLSLFGFLYGDVIEAMGHETQGAAVVLSTMLFISNFSGPLAGLILKLTSPRFVALAGAFSCSTGVFCSAFATNIWHLILSYGVLLGLGLGFIQNSTFVAINSYFKLKKSRAVGLSTVGSGVGQTVMPHVVRYLLENYGYRGACIILTGFSLNGVAGTLLIQPVEWHLKQVDEEVFVDENMHLLANKPKHSVKTDADTKDSTNFKRRATEPALYSEHVTLKYNSNKELNKPNVELSYTDSSKVVIGSMPVMHIHEGVWKKLYNLFDLTLLSSPRFLNTIIGIALCMSSLQNFSMIFPYFLQKVANLDKQQTANCMSAVALADIAGRLFLPILQDRYKIKARWVIIITSIWVVVVRQVLASQTYLITLLVMSSLYGVGRSMVVVTRNIAISENCTLDQVPAAVGLGMFTMGIMVPPVYYFLGWIRDYTGSYEICITVQNILIVILIVTWIPDMCLLSRSERNKRKGQLDLVLT